MASTPVVIRVYYDFASTLSYVSHRVLGSIDEQLVGIGVQLEWRPIDLTRITGWERGAPLDEEQPHGSGREGLLGVLREQGLGDGAVPAQDHVEHLRVLQPAPQRGGQGAGPKRRP